MTVSDALGRLVPMAQRPQRVVSLVPSESESVAALAGLAALVGRTDFCELPESIDSIRSVGGTKGFSLDVIRELEPDLILANQEENSRPQVQTLIDEGWPIHVSFPCTVRAGVDYLKSLADLLHVEAKHASIVAADEACSRFEARTESNHGSRPTAFVPIWKEPWMTFNHGAYASDVLRCVGLDNAFATRDRLYPLAADLGSPNVEAKENESKRDTRYPRTTLQEVRERAPSIILLPDEPYAFKESDRLEIREAKLGMPIEFVSGKALFWYGVHIGHALDELAANVRAH